MNWQAFFEMGGYAAFVWPSYALTLLVLAGQAGWSRWQHALAVREAQMEEGDETGTP